MGFLPGNNASLLKRIDEFQTWLVQQPERVVFVVGHSQYFRTMLKLNYNFTNCSVWRVNFDTKTETWQDAPINEFECNVDTTLTIQKRLKHDMFHVKKENHACYKEISSQPHVNFSLVISSVT